MSDQPGDPVIVEAARMGVDTELHRAIYPDGTQALWLIKGPDDGSQGCACSSCAPHDWFHEYADQEACGLTGPCETPADDEEEETSE